MGDHRELSVCRRTTGRTVDDMWEEIEAECIRTIELSAVDETIELSRRQRWKPLAFDINGDVAVVVIATRGKRAGGSVHGIPFHRRDTGWVCVGSPGGNAGDTDDRRLRRRGSSSGDAIGWSSGGGTRLASTRWSPFGRHFLEHRVFQVNEVVAFVDAHGCRNLLAEHGFCCVVWRGGRMPAVTLLSADGRRVQLVTARNLSPMRSNPLWARVSRRLASQSRRPEWFNHARGE